MLGASELVNAQGYVRDSREAYLRLAEGIRKAVNTIRSVRGLGQKTIQLGEVDYRFEAGEGSEPITLELDGNKRYPFGDFYKQPKIPRRQLEGLIADLEVLGPEIGGHMTKSGSGTDTKPAVSVYQGINVGKPPSQDEIMPYEDFRIIFQKDGSIYRPVFVRDAVIDPRQVQGDNSVVSKVNEALASYDLTESGGYVPLGYNRLALMNAVLLHLKAEIEEIENRAGMRRGRLAEKITAAEEFRQRRLL